MKKKYWILGAVLLALVVLGVWAVPAFAAGSTQNPNTQVNKARIMVRLLVVQDETKVDAFLTNAVTAGKINAAQSAKIKDVWTNNHAQFAPGKPLVRLLSVRNGTIVNVFLNRAVKAGKIQPEQATKIKALWTELHTK